MFLERFLANFIPKKTRIEDCATNANGNPLNNIACIYSVPSPFGIQDVESMNKKKSPNQIYFMSIEATEKIATKEELFSILSSTFRCTRACCDWYRAKQGGIALFQRFYRNSTSSLVEDG